ncbi:MAG: trypsin-like peptidase domain-containing protein [Clostridia bacterium]|nr:trypsin-like peptidase domain-containing protein [Clostridia bacterium]
MFDENEKYTQEAPAEEMAAPDFTDEFFAHEPVVKNKKSGNGKKVLTTALCALVAGVVFSAAMNITEKSIDVFKGHIATTQDNLKEMDATENPSLSYSEGDMGEMSVASIAKACLPSVVSITNKGVSEIMTFFGNYQTESISSGSGIIIGENDTELLIVTNYHVVADSKELTVVFSHEEEAAKNDTEATYINIAKVKGYDEDKDIAVIAVKLDEISAETKAQISIATIGNSDEIELGSGVVAIGNSLGYGQSVTHGIISAIDREITMEGVNGGEISNKYIQTDAAINSGNSGGALLNMKGELIGINSAKIAASGVEGMGYAIPISDVEELISELMSVKTRDVVPEEKRGYLGIYGADVTERDTMLYGIPQGVFVQENIKNSPADKSQLQVEDVIVKLDGISVTNKASLQDRLSYYEAGETITLSVKRRSGRAYEDLDIAVVLGSKQDAGIE